MNFAIYAFALYLTAAAQRPDTEELAAAQCLRDTLAHAPHISRVVVTEETDKPTVKYSIQYANGRNASGTLTIWRDEKPTAGLTYWNSLGGFPTDSKIDELLAKRCPSISELVY